MGHPLEHPGVGSFQPGADRRGGYEQKDHAHHVTGNQIEQAQLLFQEIRIPVVFRFLRRGLGLRPVRAGGPVVRIRELVGQQAAVPVVALAKPPVGTGGVQWHSNRPGECPRFSRPCFSFGSFRGRPLLRHRHLSQSSRAIQINKPRFHFATGWLRKPPSTANPPAKGREKHAYFDQSR